MHQRILYLKLIVSLVVLFGIKQTTAQSYWRIQNDNDLYFSKDFYYSQGLFLDYGTTIQQEKNKSLHLRLGQEIYNPSFRYVTDSKRYDYPYTGYLYLKSSILNTQIDRELEYGASIGVTGDASLAKPLQNWYHNTFLGLNSLAWEDAMPQKLLLNLYFNYKREWSIDKELNFGMESIAQLGSEKTFLGHRAYLMLGGLTMLSIDNALNTNRNSGFYFGVQQQYLFHDFMIQGPLDKSSLLERELVSYRITFVAGPVFYLGTWVMKGIWNYRSKDNSSQRHPWHPYMSISLTKIIS